MNIRRIAWRVALVGTTAGVLACAGMTGCQTSYAADIRNSSPQPVYAQLMEQFDEGATVRASTRLGPGDRGALGPVIAREGRAFVVVDTVPNPGTPVQVPLAVGTTILEIIQTGEGMSGPIQVRLVGGNPPAPERLPEPPRPGNP